MDRPTMPSRRVLFALAPVTVGLAVGTVGVAAGVVAWDAHKRIVARMDRSIAHGRALSDYYGDQCAELHREIDAGRAAVGLPPRVTEIPF